MMMAYTVTNPYTKEVIASYEVASQAEVDQALQRAQAYYLATKGQPVEKRAQKLLKLADLMEERKEQLAKIASLSMGKLIGQARSEVDLCLEILRYYAARGPQMLRAKPYLYGARQEAFLHYEASGIVLAVEPWNFPYSQVIRVLAPNYLLGNPVILKHAGQVATCAQALDELAVEADLGTGAFKNLFLSYQQVDNLLANCRVSGLAVTGSSQVGKMLAGKAAANLVKSSLELGGNDAFLVLADADVKKAAHDAVKARLRNSGQVCTAPKRLILAKEIATEFCDLLKKELAQLKLGDPLDEATTLAPLASEAALTNLTKQVTAACENGAQVLVEGGPVAEMAGYFFKPVVLRGLTPDNPMYDQEFFGPVFQIYQAQDEAEMVTIANESQYGLAGAVYSQDKVHADELAQKLSTGQVFINQPATSHPELPFGGVKNSGYGRELSDLGLYEFANCKIIAW